MAEVNVIRAELGATTRADMVVRWSKRQFVIAAHWAKVHIKTSNK
jgi:hypothetical protein